MAKEKKKCKDCDLRQYIYGFGFKKCMITGRQIYNNETTCNCNYRRKIIEIIQGGKK